MFSFFFFIKTTKNIYFTEIIAYMSKLHEEVFQIEWGWLKLTMNQISMLFVTELFKENKA